MRLYTLVVSIVVHVAVLIVVVVVPLVAMDALPAARGIKEFIRADAAALPEPPPPPGPRPVRSARDVALTTVPLEAPDRVGPEIDPPNIDSGVPIDGPLGVPHGIPNGVMPDVPVAPPPPSPPAPYRLGGKIRAPQKIRDVPPVYPHIAQISRIEGVVILEAVIGENGRVRDVRVLRSYPLLDQAAVDAVRQWVYTPTLLNGEPVPVIMTVTVAFKLQ